MKKLFKAIRSSDLEQVKEIIDANPELVNCVATPPPKKDNGQSPLQVAIKSGNFDIARFLIDMGAYLNFIEDESVPGWRIPVLHDAVNAAVMCSRWNTNSECMGFEVRSTKEAADAAFELLTVLLENGADPNGLDSKGNSAIWRFCLQAAQVLPSYNYAEGSERDDRLFTDEVHADLKRILEALRDAGADPDYAAPNMGRAPRDFYTGGSLTVILNEVLG